MAGGMSVAELSASLTFDDSQFQAGIGRADQGIASLQAKADTSGRALQTVGVGLTAVGAAGVAGFGAAVSSAADFEAQLSGIASVGGQDAVQQMDQIKAAALDMGARTSFSAGEAAAGMEELIKAGIPVSGVLGGVADAALDLAAAGGISVVDAASDMTQAVNVFGSSGQEVADTFAEVANASATGVNEIAAGFGNVAPVAKGFGLSMKDTAEAIGVMSNAGVDGAEAGTMLKSMLLSLYTPSKQQTAAMKELGLSTDDFVDASGNLIGIPEMFGLIKSSSEKLGIPMGQVKEDMATIFGSYGITAASTFFDVQQEGFDNLEQGMANAGTAQEQAAARLDNLKGAAEALGGSLETVGIAMGSNLIGPIRALTEFVTGLLNQFLALPQPIQAIITYVGAFGSALALGAGAAALIVPKILQFTEALNVLKESQLAVNVASKALSLGFGPVGIALAVVGLAIAAYTTNFLGFRDAVNAVANAVGPVIQAALSKLGDIFKTVANAVGPVLQTALQKVGSLFQTIGNVVGPALLGAVQALGPAFQKAGDGIKLFGDVLALLGGGIADKFGGAIQFIADRLNDLRSIAADPISFAASIDIGPIDDIVGAVAAKIIDLKNAIETFQMPGWLTDFGDFLQHEIGDRIAAVTSKLGEWKDALASGHGLADGLMPVSEWFDEHFPGAVDKALVKIYEFEKGMQDLSAQTQTGFQTTSDNIFEWLNGLGEASGLAHVLGEDIDNLATSQSGLVEQTNRWGAAIGGATNLTGAAITATDEVAGATNRWGFALSALGQEQQQQIEYSDAQLEAMTKIADGYRDVLPGSVNVFTNSLAMATQGNVEFFTAMQDLDDIGVSTFSEMGQAVLDWGQAFTSVQGSLNTTLATIQQIQALGQGISSAQQVAAGIVGDPGTYATVDDLLAKGLITQQQYTDAVQASAQITTAQALAQDRLNAMVAEYLPTLADQAVAQEGLIGQLERMGPAQREVALQMMDAGNQAKVAAAFSAAYSGALGEIPPEVASSIILNSARADPVLANLLDTYGLVEQGANGEITVTMPSESDLVLEQFKTMFGEEGQRVFMVDGLIHVTNGSGTELVYDQFHNLVEQSGTTIPATIDIQFAHGTEAGIASGAGFGATFDNVGTDIATTIETSVQQADFSGVGTAVETNVGVALTAVDVSTDAATLATSTTGAISTGITDDSAAVSLAVESVMSEAVEAGVTSAEDANRVGAMLISSAGDQITSDAGTITDKLNAAVSDAVSASVTTAETANQVGAKLVMATGDQVVSDGPTIGDRLSAVVGDAIAAGDQAASDAISIGEGLVGAILSGLGQEMSNVSTSVENIVGDAIQAGQTKAGEATSVGTEIMAKIGEGVSSGASSFASAVSDAVSSALTGLDSLAGAASAAGTAIGQALIKGITDSVAAGIGQVRGQIEAGLSGLSVNIPVSVNADVTQTVTQQVVGAVETATPYVEDASYGMGAAIDTGTAAGVADNAQAPIGAVTTMANNTIGAGHTTFGIGSPSKVFYDMGYWITEGLRLGIVDGIPGVVDSMGQMVEPLNELEADLLNLAEIAGKSFAQNLSDTIISGHDLMLDAAGQVVDQFGNALAEDFTVYTDGRGGPTDWGERISTMIVDGMEKGGVAIQDAGVAAGTAYTTGIGLAMVNGVLNVTDAAGQLLRPLNDLEVSLVKEATYAGTEFVNNLIAVLASGAELAVDATGQITDGIGNVLASDFTLIAEDSLVKGYDIVSAMANGMVGATPQVVGASVYVADQAMVPLVEMSTRAYDAATDSVIDAAGGMLETAPVLAEAAAVAASGATAEFAQMYNDIVAYVNGILEQADVAARAASSISSSGAASNADDTGRIRVHDRGGHAHGRNADASGGSFSHGNIDGNANVDVDVSGGRAVDRSGRGRDGHHRRSGHTTINNTYNVRDGRHMERASRRQHRQQRLAASRG